MKILPSIGFNDFSGSAGNVTARKVGDKTYLSSRTKHARTKTPSQAATRCRFTDATRGYANITEEQRQGWISLAFRLGRYFTSSGYVTMTGHNLFVAINSYRQLCGKPLIADAPPEIKPSRYIRWRDLWITPEHIVFTHVGIRESPSEVLLIETYPSPSPGIKNGWSRTVILTVCPETDWGDVDITEAFIQKYGAPLTIGQTLYMKVSWLDSECGYLSAFTHIAFPACENTPYGSDLEYTPRARITMKDIVPETEFSVCEAMDYELSPGSKITSNSITIRHREGSTKINCTFLHHGLPEAFIVERSYQYARGTAENNYFIQCVNVIVLNNSSKNISIGRCAGIFTSHFETFGTYYTTT
ncbi:MAG: hypothetical protein WCQ69_07035 [Bacteroidales bacterium]|jgi:hypothetical protein|nr:hypothetical protein [Bacteroidales bacterium]MDD2265154.1 hypothetical protein [Bacteroidales bacterium]MDD2832334.1 hypothetical protein [Bacteroidales bacterium]MDD3209528.1 hypothetical protein [Bacteroidales bacterium]MDD3698099.1 hypothetical protein [Bacteroidales bacterium]